MRRRLQLLGHVDHMRPLQHSSWLFLRYVRVISCWQTEVCWFKVMGDAEGFKLLSEVCWFEVLAEVLGLSCWQRS